MSKYHDPIEHDPHGDYFYKVTLVHDEFTVSTLIMASNDDDAIQGAKSRLTVSAGLPDWIATDENECRAVVEGELT